MVIFFSSKIRHGDLNRPKHDQNPMHRGAAAALALILAAS
jgi:hypothetical protein